MQRCCHEHEWNEIEQNWYCVQDCPPLARSRRQRQVEKPNWHPCVEKSVRASHAAIIQVSRNRKKKKMRKLGAKKAAITKQQKKLSRVEEVDPEEEDYEPTTPRRSARLIALKML